MHGFVHKQIIQSYVTAHLSIRVREPPHSCLWESAPPSASTHKKNLRTTTPLPPSKNSGLWNSLLPSTVLVLWTVFFALISLLRKPVFLLALKHVLASWLFEIQNWPLCLEKAKAPSGDLSPPSHRIVPSGLILLSLLFFWTGWLQMTCVCSPIHVPIP